MNDGGPAATADADAVAAVARALGHTVADTGLLRRALTHASRCGAQATLERKLREANERLEFLGDALLGAAVAQILFERFPASDEGHLSRWRGTLASRATLARAIEAAGLLPHCLVGAQMAGDHTRWPDSVKANLMEAILAAVWLDGGWAPLRTAVERALAPFLDDPESGREDARMRLQEWSLGRWKRLPDYACDRSGGTDHVPEFTARVSAGGRSAEGRGGSRRRAEAAAAEALLREIDADAAAGGPATP
jgi:ribonuclease-3